MFLNNKKIYIKIGTNLSKFGDYFSYLNILKKNLGNCRNMSWWWMTFIFKNISIIRFIELKMIIF